MGQVEVAVTLFLAFWVAAHHGLRRHAVAETMHPERRGIYESRPDVCRSYMPGGRGCVTARMELGM